MLRVLYILFVRDFWLKVLAIAVATVVWFYVEDKLSEEQTVDVPLTAEDFKLESRDRMIVSHPEGVRVILRGPRGLLQRVSGQDLAPDKPLVLNEDQMLGDDPVTLSPSDLAVPEGLSIVEISPRSFNVRTDQIHRRALRVRPDPRGVPAEGYEFGGVSAEPEEVVVQGPAEIMDPEVQYISTEEIDITGKSKTIERRRADLLSHVNGPEGRIPVTVDDKDRTVEVRVAIQARQLERELADVPVLWGTDADLVGGVKLDPATVTVRVAGPVQVVKEMTHDDVDVFVRVPDLGASSYEITPRVDLPPQVVLRQRVPSVKVTLLPAAAPRLVRRTLNSLSIEPLFGRDQELQVKAAPERIDLEVQGLPEYMEQFSPEDVRVLLPLDGLQPGTHRRPVTVSLPPGIAVVPPVPEVDVTIAASRDEQNGQTEDAATVAGESGSPESETPSPESPDDGAAPAAPEEGREQPDSAQG